MPRRAKLRAGNAGVIGEKAAMLQKITEITKNEGENNSVGTNVGDMINFTAKKKRSGTRLNKSASEKKLKKSKKREKNVEIDSGDSSDEDSESEQINLKNDKKKLIKEQYTFEFNDMKNDYTESICSMLKISLIINPSAAFVLANSVTEQTIVGTSVVCEGGDDVFGFATVLPTEKIFNNEKNSLEKNTIQNPFVVLLNEFQVKLNSMADKSVKSAFSKYLFDPVHRRTSGVILQSRFTNLPIQLIVDLHKNLNEDIKYALEHSDSEDGFQGMKYLIHICKCSLDGQSPADIVNITGSSSALYDQFEDEMYGQDADYVLLFKPSNVHCSIAICLINMNKLDNIQNNIVKLCQ